ncbi:MAG: betaine-aldehyde dehydrogenase, partial [Sphingomonas bacterium]|nr:betaine-aldehyde dehydrogenase [Sphingomonas bacterium]
WTRDLGTAHGLARRIGAGTITINGGGGSSPMPFGGFKQSWLGREGGREGVLAYTEIKTVSVGF